MTIAQREGPKSPILEELADGELPFEAALIPLQVTDLLEVESFPASDADVIKRRGAGRKALDFFVRNPWRRFRERPYASSARLVTAMGGAAVGATIALMHGASNYDADIAGIHVETSVSASLFGGGEASLDSSVGSVTAKPSGYMPISVKVLPQIDNLEAVENIAKDPEAAVPNIVSDLKAEAWPAGIYFGSYALGGLLLGGVVSGAAAELLTSKRQERNVNLYAAKLLGRAASRSVIAAGLTAATMGGVAYAQYDPHWLQSYETTGLIAEAQLAPEKLAEYYKRNELAAGYAVSAITVWDKLGEPAPYESMEQTEFNLAIVSDLHNDTESLDIVAKLAKAKNVKAVLIAGDLTEFGLPEEITPEYEQAFRRITDRGIPIVVITGNHEGSAVAKKLAKIPNVYVLDDTMVNAYGLVIGGAGDPMGNLPAGGTGLSPEQNSQEEAKGAQQAVATLGSNVLDIFMSHNHELSDAVAASMDARLTISGHVHKQNDPSDVQGKDGGLISIVEGTSNNGIIRHYLGADKDAPAPGAGVASASLLGVSATCQFTQIERMQVRDTAMTVLHPDKITLPPNVLAQTTTINLKPQPVTPGRKCTVGQGVSWRTGR
jgi:predicted phosphodiesterase